MKDYISLGSAPADEQCASVGEPDYDANARLECLRFIELLRNVFGSEPDGAEFGIVANRHDFGIYYEVVCHYEMLDEEAKGFALKCEANCPVTWNADPHEHDSIHGKNKNI